MLSVAVWPADEISTRNCRNCLAPKEGVYVSCRKGHPMITGRRLNRHALTYNGVLKLGKLLLPCRGCKDFDNDWR